MPIVFDTSAVGSNASAAYTFSMTPAAGSTVVLFHWGGSIASAPTYGGVPMTQLCPPFLMGVAAFQYSQYAWVYYIRNVSGSAATISVPSGGKSIAVSYTGVGSVQPAFSGTGSAGVTATSDTGRVSAFGSYYFNGQASGATHTSYNQTIRRQDNTTGWQIAALVGDAPGAASVTHTTTFSFASSGALIGSVGVDLIPNDALTLSSYAGTGTSIAIPHNSGDLIVMYAHASANGALPTPPAAGGTVPAWATLNQTAGTNWSNARTVWAVGTGSTTSGTWTNTSQFVVVVLTGADAATPIGGRAISAVGVGGSMTAPAVTMSKTDGTSKLLHFYGMGDAVNGNGTVSAVAAGYTRLRAFTPTSLLGSVLNAKTVTTSDGAVIQSKSGGSWFSAATVEVLAADSGAPVVPTVPTNQFFQMF